MDSIDKILDVLVDMKGNCEFIDDGMAELQKKTSAKIIETLYNRPGVILGDDVGMGKTYIAIATIYYLQPTIISIRIVFF
jgi:SNF2 family DNA or RNA helicase